MIKVDIISGFLGAGKTTFIKELISKVYGDEKIVLIENEFGEIGIDSRFMQDAGIEVTEMNSGCICCTLVGDFARALKLVSEEYGPDRIVIEPSGVGKLSDVAKAVIGVEEDAADNIMGKIFTLLRDRGFWTYTHENMIIVAPPLIITEDELRAQLAILDDVLSQVDEMI